MIFFEISNFFQYKIYNFLIEKKIINLANLYKVVNDMKNAELYFNIVKAK